MIFKHLNILDIPIWLYIINNETIFDIFWGKNVISSSITTAVDIRMIYDVYMSYIIYKSFFEHCMYKYNIIYIYV